MSRRGLSILLAIVAALLAPPAVGRAACPPVTEAPGPAQIQAAMQNARDHGFLWRISRLGRSSWLYGTLHVGKLEWLFPGPQVGAALRGADTLALEIDVTDPALRDRLAAGARAFPAWVPAPAMQRRIEHQIAAACVPNELFAGQHPLMQLMTLTVLAARWDGLDAAFGQEFALGGVARALQRPIVSLETPELQQRLLLDMSEADARQAVEQMLDQLDQGGARGVLARLAGAWERGDLAELEGYERWCDCVETDDDRAFLRRLNDDRNGALADHIDRLHRGGQRVFAAVGTLHMTGPRALPVLMAQRGYEVERILFAR
jgi:uncharacterized protein YbaP (TraB family)